MSDPYYQWYPGDYQRDTADLSLIEHGAYRVLLDHYYCNGMLPDDPPRLNRIANATTKKEKLAVDFITNRFFSKNGDGFLVNKRAEKEVNKRKDFLKQQSDRGKRSARLRDARKKGTHQEIEWLLLVEQTNGICPKCNKKTSVFDKDHVLPLYKGGADSIDNIQPLCPRCNAGKGSESIDYFIKQRCAALPNIFNSG